MISDIKDGGPAFPNKASYDGQSGYSIHGGMTLRDYFAAHAPVPQTAMPVAEHCAYRYRYADAMLAARAQGGVA